jgi:hypothetical protein
MLRRQLASISLLPAWHKLAHRDWVVVRGEPMLVVV